MIGEIDIYTYRETDTKRANKIRNILCALENLYIQLEDFDDIAQAIVEDQMEKLSEMLVVERFKNEHRN